MNGSISADRTVCTRPFEWFEIHPGGNVFACCPAWLKTPMGNALSDSLEEIWNGPVARRIRTSILDGSFQYCRRSRCPKMASGTGPYRCLAEVADREVRESLRAGGIRLPYGPKRLNLCFDRSCNLACPSCRREPFISCGAERERGAALGRRMAQLAGPSAEELRVSGTGDPFASPVYREVLGRITPGDFPRLRNIHLHTNGLLWDKAGWEALPAIHPFVRTAEISVDAATPGTYALNRGGDFARLLRTFDFLLTLPVSVKISCVVQANNWREMPAFAELGRGYGFRVYFSHLVNWGTFSRDEFARRAVHLPGHPENAAFRSLLAKVARQEHVDAGNL